MASKTELIRTTNLLIEKARRELQRFSQIQAQTSGSVGIQRNNNLQPTRKALPDLRTKSKGTLSSKCAAAHGCSGQKQHVEVSIDASSGKGLKVVLRSAPGAALPASANQPAHCGPASTEARLTPCQLRVLLLIINGLPNRAIASKLHCSIKTVEKHRQQLHTKLGAHEAAGLTRRAIAFGIVRSMRHGWQPIAERAKQLTVRELEVLKLVAQGACNKWIAAQWGRSMKTVDHHREHIMKKLGVHDVPGLTQCAVALNLLNTNEPH